MEQKRNLRINCAVCDMSAAAESTLAAYDTIRINAALILTSAKTQELVPKYDITLNAASVCNMPEGAELRVVNGSHEILPGDMPGKPLALLVNGSLEIARGTEQVLQKYPLIHVNGSVTYPDTLLGALSMLSVNGSAECYPADAVRLKSSFVVDKIFLLRAKAGRYYARRRVVLLGDTADAAALHEKGVRFITGTAILVQSAAEAALPLFGEEVEVQIVPDGCAYVEGDAALEEALLRKHGAKLYISGDLVLTEESEPLIGQLQYLKVRGCVQLPQSLTRAFCAIPAEYGELLATKGMVVKDKVAFTLDKGLLERHPEGITFIDCVRVKLDQEISPEWIEERLAFKDCVSVSCTPEQRSAVELAGHDVAQIGLLDEIFDPQNTQEPDTQVINTAEYRLL